MVSPHHQHVPGPPTRHSMRSAGARCPEWRDSARTLTSQSLKTRPGAHIEQGGQGWQRALRPLESGGTGCWRRGGGGGEVIRKEGKTSTGGYARAAFDQRTWEKGSSEEESRAETHADRKRMRLGNLSGPGGAVLRGDGLVPLQDLSPRGWQGPWFGRCIHAKRKCRADLSTWPPAFCTLLIRGRFSCGSSPRPRGTSWALEDFLRKSQKDLAPAPKGGIPECCPLGVFATPLIFLR